MTNIILLSDIFLASLTMLLLLAASITDLKKREVPNWLSFSFIGIATAIRAITSIISSYSLYFLYVLFSFFIFFVIANFFYYSRIFGGGDAKLLMALSVLLATDPVFLSVTQGHFIRQSPKTILTQMMPTEPLLLTLLINLFTLGSLYGLGFSIFSVIKNKRSFWKNFKKENKKMGLFRTFFWLGAFISLILSFSSSKWFFFIFVILFLSPYLYLFVKTAESVSMIKKISPNKLTEGDWIIAPIKTKERIIMPSIHGLSKEDIESLKKYKKQVLVKYGLPFVPVFLVAFICSLFLGNLLFIALSLLFGL